MLLKGGVRAGKKFDGVLAQLWRGCVGGAPDGLETEPARPLVGVDNFQVGGLAYDHKIGEVTLCADLGSKLIGFLVSQARKRDFDSERAQVRLRKGPEHRRHRALGIGGASP